MATTKPFLLLPPQPTSPPARPRLLAPRPRRAQASSVACSAADADDRWLEPARGARRGARGAVAPDAAAAGGPWVRRARRVGRRRWPLHGHRRGGVAPRVPAALPLPQVPGRLRVHPGLRDLRGHARAVRIRGVAVGSFVRVDSSLHSIDAYAELHSKVEDEKIIVPRNSLVEMNQSGLVMETMIDITPKDPLPTPSVGPLDPDCSREGLILCDKERIKGQQGVNLDAMVGILTRLGRDMEQIGVDKSFKLAEKVASIMEGAQPLLSQVCDSDLLKDVEIIAKGLADASGDLRKLQSSMLTTENTDLITQSIFTLVFTLKNIESISSDISGFTGDETTRQNIKLLVRSLSRLL